MKDISLKKQIVFAFLVILISIIGIDIIANNYLLDNFYLKNKQKNIINVAQEIDQNTSNLFDDEFLRGLERTCHIQNLSLLVVDEETTPVLYFYSKEEETETKTRLNMYIAETNRSDRVFDNVKNETLGINYIEVCGKLSNGYFYLIKTPIESIKESSALSIRFLLYITAILLPVSIVIMLIVVENITQPLKKLTKVSTKISSLDFSEKVCIEGSTEIVELGKNFNKMSDELEKNIGELKTANAKLQDDLVKKQQLEKMKNDFMSSVSHELKTPIAIISGYAESLADNIVDEPEDIKFYSETIYDEAQKLSDMVQQILTINKMEFHEAEINIQRINIYNVIEEIVAPMQKIISDKNLDFQININKNQTVWTDESLIKQIVSNYITNAIDHVNVNGKVTVDLEEYDNKYKLKVFNTGSNIADEYKDMIWEKFFKIDKSRHREFGGTGLGLSLVSTFAKVLNQEYGFQNLRNGIVFYITCDKN